MIYYEIKVHGWAKHQTDKRLKNMAWFKLQSDFFLDKEVLEMTPGCKLAFIYILSACARANTDLIRVSNGAVTKLVGLRTKVFQEALGTLEQFQILTVLDHGESTAKSKKESKSKNKGNTTCSQKPRIAASTKSGDAQKVVDLWNEICGHDCPQVRTLTAARKVSIGNKLKKYSLADMHWLFTKVAESDFLCGRGSDWKCDFDWVLKGDKPVVISEGKYDNRKTQGKTGSVLKEVYDEWTK